MGKDGGHNVSYTIFIDGVQTVLLFSDDIKVIEAASGVCISFFCFHKKMNQLLI